MTLSYHFIERIIPHRYAVSQNLKGLQSSRTFLIIVHNLGRTNALCEALLIQSKFKLISCRMLVICFALVSAYQTPS